MASRTLKAARDNVETIADLHHAANSRAGAQQRRIESLASRLGRPMVLYVLVGLIFCWVIFNLAAHVLGLRALDPAPFQGLQTVMTLAGLLLTTVVVITQNRQMLMAERRAQLDLHVNLLSEQKIAKLVALVEEMRRDSPHLPNRRDLEAEEMSQATDAHAIVEAIEQRLDAGENPAAREEREAERK